MRGPLDLQHAAVGGLVTHLGGPGRRTGAGALRRHRRIEGGPVDLHSGVTGQFLCQFDREAVGVVQGEGHVAPEHLVAGGERLLQAPQPGAQGPVEAGFLALEDGEDHVVVLDQRRPGSAQHLGGGVDQHGRHGAFDAEPPRGQDGPPDHAAQDIAPPLVGREDAVGHQHGHGPPVIGHEPQGDVGLLVAAVGGSDGRGGRLDNRCEQVGLEGRVAPLQNGEDPFQTGPGVDVLLRELGPGAVGRLVELHEDQVPDLDVAVLVPVLGAAALAVLRPLIDEDLRIRSAGTGGPHGPEVVVIPHALDPFGRQPHLVDPDLLRLVVAVVHGDPQAVAVEAEHVGQQLPGQRNGDFLEVVAEAEIAQHLEEGVVIGIGAHDLDVEGAEALLHAGGPRPGSLLVTDEVRLEGHHAGDGEEHRRVVGNQAGGGDGRMPPVGEEAGEGRPQFIGVHQTSLPAATWTGGLSRRPSPRSVCSRPRRRSSRGTAHRRR